MDSVAGPVRPICYTAQKQVDAAAFDDSRVIRSSQLSAGLNDNSPLTEEAQRTCSGMLSAAGKLCLIWVDCTSSCMCQRMTYYETYASLATPAAALGLGAHVVCFALTELFLPPVS